MDICEKFSTALKLNKSLRVGNHCATVPELFYVSLPPFFLNFSRMRWQSFSGMFAANVFADGAKPSGGVFLSAQEEETLKDFKIKRIQLVWILFVPEHG